MSKCLRNWDVDGLRAGSRMGFDCGGFQKILVFKYLKACHTKELVRIS